MAFLTNYGSHRYTVLKTALGVVVGGDPQTPTRPMVRMTMRLSRQPHTS